MKPPRLVLDLDAVCANVASWRTFEGGREVWAVVKADAYRLGALTVARVCLAAGATRLVASDVEQAYELRETGITAPILLLSATQASEMADVVRLELIPTIAEPEPARALAAVAERRASSVRAHIAVDTDTGWTGVPSTEAGALAAQLAPLRWISWEGAYTHLAGPESAQVQLSAFSRAVDAMRAQGLPLPVLHVASTAPTLWGVNVGPVRIGIGLYGSRLGAASSSIPLRTALHLTATVIAVKRFDEPTPLGYGGKYIAAPGDTIATLRIGYVDGLPCTFADGGGGALIRGVRCPIVGAIGMQFTMVHVPPGVPIALGEEMTLLHNSEGAHLDDVARMARILPHQLVTALGAATRPSFAAHTR